MSISATMSQCHGMNCFATYFTHVRHRWGGMGMFTFLEHAHMSFASMFDVTEHIERKITSVVHSHPPSHYICKQVFLPQHEYWWCLFTTRRFHISSLGSWFFSVLGDPLLKCLPQRHLFSFRHTHEKTPWSTYVFLPALKLPHDSSEPRFSPNSLLWGLLLKKKGVHRLARACSVGRGLGVAAWAWLGRAV